MPKDFEIVALKPEHDKRLALIVRNALKEHKANKPGTVFFDPTTDHLSQVFLTKNSNYFVLICNGEIAGGAGYYPTEGLPEGTCELVKMYLAPEYRKRGFGKLLISTCIEQAGKAGYKAMYLETLPELTTAIPLYEKFGFENLNGPLGKSGHFGCTIWMLKPLN